MKNVMTKKSVCLFMLFLALMTGGKASGQNENANASDSRVNRWFVQGQVGANYLAAESARFLDFGEILSPAYSIAAGKYFNSLWGMRFQMLGGGDKGVYYPRSNSPKFDFKHIAGMAELTLNVTNVFRKKENRDGQKWNIDVMMGPGVIHTYSFDRKGVTYPGLDSDAKTYLAFCAGIDVTYRLNADWDLSMDLDGQIMKDKYNGIVDDVRSEGLANLMMGVRYYFR